MLGRLAIMKFAIWKMNSLRTRADRVDNWLTATNAHLPFATQLG